MQQLTIRSDDGTPLRLVRWGEEGGRDVLLVHGLAEHAGRYEHVARAMVDAGWRVSLVELRGHGRSGGRRGHVRRWHEYVEDIRSAVGTIARPYVLVAHSMGGLAAVRMLEEPASPRVLGLALSNPLLGVAVQASAPKLAAARLLSRLLPALPLDNELDPAWLSHDPEVVRAYEADPLVYDTITPRWFTEMQAAIERAHAEAERGRVPLRLMLAGEDRICDPGAARRLGERWGGSVEIVEYPGLYHEIFNEIEKDRVISELLAWMEKLPAAD